MPSVIFERMDHAAAVTVRDQDALGQGRDDGVGGFVIAHLRAPFLGPEDMAVEGGFMDRGIVVGVVKDRIAFSGEMDVETVRHAEGQGVIGAEEHGIRAVGREPHEAASVGIHLLGFESKIDVALGVVAKPVAVAHLDFRRQHQLVRRVFIAEAAGAAGDALRRLGRAPGLLEGGLNDMVMTVALAGKGEGGKDGACVQELAAVHGWGTPKSTKRREPRMRALSSWISSSHCWIWARSVRASTRAWLPDAVTLVCQRYS